MADNRTIAGKEATFEMTLGELTDSARMELLGNVFQIWAATVTIILEN